MIHRSHRYRSSESLSPIVWSLYSTTCPLYFTVYHIQPRAKPHIHHCSIPCMALSMITNAQSTTAPTCNQQHLHYYWVMLSNHQSITEWPGINVTEEYCSTWVWSPSKSQTVPPVPWSQWCCTSWTSLLWLHKHVFIRAIPYTTDLENRFMTMVWEDAWLCMGMHTLLRACPGVGPVELFSSIDMD